MSSIKFGHMKIRKDTDKGRSMNEVTTRMWGGGMARGIEMVAAGLNVRKMKGNKNEERKECEFAKECEGT